MRLLFLTDTHFRGTSPQHRRDNLMETQKEKMREVAALVRELEINAVIHGGDLWDSPQPSLAVGAEFGALLKELGVPVYAVPGNHDLFGQNPATLPRTMLGLLARWGIVHLLEPEKPVFLRGGGVVVQLTGQGFHYDMDRRDPLLDYAVRKKEGDVAIHVVHGMLLDRSLYPGAPCTLIERVAPFTQADYTLCGHAHLGFPDTCLYGRWFLNPGALVRLSALPQEVQRRPQVIVLDFTGGRPVHRAVALKCARPGEEVLDRAALEEAAFREERLALFVQGIRSGGDYLGLSLEEIVDSIARRQGLAEEVRVEALRRLGKVQAEILRRE
ncbi:metallophosphoesterase family protein [Desulfovirgula thermocuniculi]|uniref:metallophosphoesterase family protein n=1 Tax=Desulfovirgula thermocuniculi TaxID=348842 RepID=UPI0004202FF2|nr:metallophosphoesterase [Desulfovirgula thermocuniculi]